MRSTMTMIYDFYQILLNPFKEFQSDYYYRAPSSGEVIVLVWPWVMLQGVYDLLFIRFSHLLWQSYGPGSWGEERFPFKIDYPASMNVFNILIGVALYPVIAYALIKVWELLIQVSLDFMGKKDIPREKIIATIHHSFAANIFLVVPLIGSVAQKFMSAFLLFAGLVGNLKLGKLQAVVVILLPLIFAGLLLVFMAILVGLQFSMPS